MSQPSIFQEKMVFVTGGSSGLETARQLLLYGAEVLIAWCKPARLRQGLSVLFLKYTCWALSLLSCALSATGQSSADTFVLHQTLSVQARFATADNLGNIYLITTQNAVEKYAADGRLLTRYTNNRLGTAAWLDVTNPLKVLVWYADFRTAVFLDRSLTALGEINLISAGYPEVRTVASAADGDIWLYDEVAFQLKKITPDGTLRFESQALNQIQAERITVAAIRDDGAQVLATDSTVGVLCFDVFGQFQRMLPWTGIAQFVLIQNRLEHLTENTLHIEHLQAFATRDIPLPPTAKTTGAQVWGAPGRVLVQNGDVLEVWSR